MGRERADKPLVAVAAMNDRRIYSRRDLEVEGASLASLRARNNRPLPTGHNSQSAHRIWHVRREETDLGGKEQTTLGNFTPYPRPRPGENILGLGACWGKRAPEMAGMELCVWRCRIGCMGGYCSMLEIYHEQAHMHWQCARK